MNTRAQEICSLIYLRMQAFSIKFNTNVMLLVIFNLNRHFKWEKDIQLFNYFFFIFNGRTNFWVLQYFWQTYTISICTNVKLTDFISQFINVCIMMILMYICYMLSNSRNHALSLNLLDGDRFVLIVLVLCIFMLVSRWSFFLFCFRLV